MSFGKLSKIILFYSLVSSINLNSMISSDNNQKGIEIPRRYTTNQLLSLSSSPLAIRPKDMSPIQGITLPEEDDEENNLIIRNI